MEPFKRETLADEPNHDAARNPQSVGQRPVWLNWHKRARGYPIGNHEDFGGVYAARHDLVLQALTDRDHCVTPPEHCRLDVPNQSVIEMAFRHLVLIDRRILPESPHFIDEWEPQSSRSPSGRHPTQNGRMRMY
jgi:hypothetical protein